MAKKRTIKFYFATRLQIECFMYEVFRDRQVTNDENVWLLTNGNKIEVEYDAKNKAWFLYYSTQQSKETDAEYYYEEYLNAPSYETNKWTDEVCARIKKDLDGFETKKLSSMVIEENALRKQLKKTLALVDMSTPNWN